MPAWCPDCGAMLPEGLESCPRCGKKLKQASVANPDELTPAEFWMVTLETLKILLIPVALALLLGIVCYWMLS